MPQTTFGKIFSILFGCIGIPFTIYLSSQTISLLMPIILRWRTATVHCFSNHFAASQPNVSVVSTPSIPTAGHFSNGEVQAENFILFFYLSISFFHDSLSRSFLLSLSTPATSLGSDDLEFPIHSPLLVQSFLEKFRLW